MRHLSLQNVLATAAACLAVAGGAYASHYSIRGGDVINGSLRGGDVQDNSIAPADVKGLGPADVGNLTGADLEPGTLLKGLDGDKGYRGYRGPEGLRGDFGPRGPVGSKGNIGQKGYRGFRGVTGSTGSAATVVVRTAGAVVLSSGSPTTAEASCLPGERAVGGGGHATGRAHVYRSAPTPLPRAGDRNGPTGWIVGALTVSPRTRSTVTPYVVCFP